MTCAVVLPSTAPLYVDMDVTTKGIEEPVAAEPQDGSYSLSLLLLSCSTEPTLTGLLNQKCLPDLSPSAVICPWQTQ